MDYELTVDGEMIDATDPGEPLEFIQGYEISFPAWRKPSMVCLLAKPKRYW
jgi:hypothetical protein